MFKSVRTIVLIVLTLMPLTWAASVFAQILPSAPTSSISEKGWQGVINLIDLARNWLFGILLAVVVVFILIGAFNFLTAGGDDSKIKKGKNIIKNAIIALVIGMLCGGIILIVTSFFDAATRNKNTSSNLCHTDTDCAKIISDCATQTCKCNTDGSCTIY